MFAGSLDRPNQLQEFRFCPPVRRPDGSFDASGNHLNLDATLMNFMIDHDFRKRGLDMLGIGHSHPGQYRRLSYGDRNVNEGDVVYFKSCLAADDSEGKRWKICWAPILTFDDNGRPVVDWFAVTLDDPDPLPAVATIIPNDDSDAFHRAASRSLADPAFPLDQLAACNQAYRSHILALMGDEALPDSDKVDLATALRSLRQHDFAKKVARLTDDGSRDRST
jgi:hypothetical protein